MRALISGQLRGLFYLLFGAVCLLAASPPLLRAEEENKFPLSQPLTVRWQYETEGTVNLTPAAYDKTVYLPLSDGDLLALGTAGGELLWRAETGGKISAAPIADASGVYIASEIIASAKTSNLQATGALRSLGHRSGVARWMRTLQSPLLGSLALGRSMLFGGSADGRVYAFRKDTGEIAWTMQHHAAFASAPVAHGERLYIGSEDGTLFAIDQTSGRVIWRYRTRGALRGPVSVSSDTIFFGSGDSYVYALRSTDGRLRWRARTGAGVQGVAYTQKGLVVASLDNFVYFLATPQGERLWKRQLAGRIAAQPLATADGVLLVPLAGDACVVLDLDEGKQINRLLVGDDNNTAASPLIAGRQLLLTTRRGLLAFSSPSASAGQQ